MSVLGKLRENRVFRYVGIPLLMLLTIALVVFVVVDLLRDNNQMGIRLETLYKDLYNNSLDANSQMDVTIKTKDCTLEVTYSGDTYQRVKAVSGDQSCTRFNYVNGDRPSPINRELVSRDLQNAYTRQKRLDDSA